MFCDYLDANFPFDFKEGYADFYFRSTAISNSHDLNQVNTYQLHDFTITMSINQSIPNDFKQQNLFIKYVHLFNLILILDH